MVTEKPKVTEQKMMETPSLWPQWPWLPLKKVGGREIGCIFASAAGGDPVTFVSANLWGLDALKDKPVKEWPGYRLVTPADLVKEGWIVD